MRLCQPNHLMIKKYPTSRSVEPKTTSNVTMITLPGNHLQVLNSTSFEQATWATGTGHGTLQLSVKSHSLLGKQYAQRHAFGGNHSPRQSEIIC